jgi:Tol biopolymer transport system component
MALAGVVGVKTLGGQRTTKAVPRLDAVLYGIGLSTDPYGASGAQGIGVAFGIGRGRPETATIRRQDLRNATWIREGRALVIDFVRGLPRYQLLRADDGLRLAGAAPVPKRVLNLLWSPDGRWIAYQRALRCRDRPSLESCYGAGRRTFIVDAADSSTPSLAVDGQAVAWTPRARLVVPRRGDLEAVAPRGELRTLLLSRDRVAVRAGGLRRGFLSAPIWSPDGRFMAAMAHLAYPRLRSRDRVGTIVVATGAGRIVRVFHSRYLISMLAWSPRGHRLAWTTTGFPAPHEVMVAELGTLAAPQRLFAKARHFDWIAWSPDGRRLLLDDENDGAGSWRLLDVDRPGRVRVLERLGGQPQWCCPQNSFVTMAGGWSAGTL